MEYKRRRLPEANQAGNPPISIQPFPAKAPYQGLKHSVNITIPRLCRASRNVPHSAPVRTITNKAIQPARSETVGFQSGSTPLIGAIRLEHFYLMWFYFYADKILRT